MPTQKRRPHFLKRPPREARLFAQETNPWIKLLVETAESAGIPWRYDRPVQPGQFLMINRQWKPKRKNKKH